MFPEIAKTTAIDMLKMLCYATRYDELMQAWSQPSYVMQVFKANSMRKIILKTTANSLKRNYPNVIGAKTGTLNRYGYNIGEIVQLNNGCKAALVVMGAKNESDRTYDIDLLRNHLLADIK